MACQFNSSELAPLDEIGSYIQDAVDLIEFANGPATNPWGRRRADMGHPQPFNLKLLGVGNEQWGPQYLERYERFAKALKAKHPEIRLVSSAGASASARTVRVDFAGGRPSGTGRALVLTGDSNGENSLDAAAAIAPAERTFELIAAPIEQPLPAHSLTVLRIPVR